MKMADELANVTAKSSADDKVNYLKSSFKFRAYFSHDSATGDFYKQWHVGPVTDPKAVYKDSIDDVIKKFLAANAAALGGSSSAVFQAFAANYRVIDYGTAAHPTMVKANDNLKDAISVLPKRAGGLTSHEPTLIPPAVHQTLGNFRKVFGPDIARLGQPTFPARYEPSAHSRRKAQRHWHDPSAQSLTPPDVTSFLTVDIMRPRQNRDVACLPTS